MERMQIGLSFFRHADLWAWQARARGHRDGVSQAGGIPASDAESAALGRTGQAAGGQGGGDRVLTGFGRRGAGRSPAPAA